MFHYIPTGSKIIGKKYGRYIWKTPDAYNLMIASGNPYKDSESIIKNKHLLGSNFDLKHDLAPDKGSRIIELNDPDENYGYDLKLDSAISSNNAINNYVQNLSDNLMDSNDVPILISQREGGNFTKGYIPTDKYGKVIGNSGVTVGKGIDVSQKNKYELNNN